MWWWGRCAGAACCTDAVLLHETRAHVYDELRPLMVERTSCSITNPPSAAAQPSPSLANEPLPGMYTARHRATHELVALKVYRKRLLARHDVRCRLRREVRMLSLCRDHPHLLTLYGVYSTSATLEIAFELARGGEVMTRLLDQQQQQRPRAITDAPSPRPSLQYVYNEREVSRVIASVVAGLGYLHARGVIHGEVRPEHVLYCDLEPDARVVLADFGRAAVWTAGDLSLATRTRASPRRQQAQQFLWDDPHHVKFLPPFALARKDDRIATWREAQQLDTWALGVTMYVLLCAAFPFRASRDSDDGASTTNAVVDCTIQSVLTEPLVFPDDGATISRAARDLLTRLLVKDPDESLTLEQVEAHPWIQDSVASDVLWSSDRLATHSAFAAAYSDEVAAVSRRRRVSPAAYAYSLADRTAERPPPHRSSSESKSSSSNDDEDRDVFAAALPQSDGDDDVERPSFVSTTGDVQQAIQQLATTEDEPLSADAYMRLASDEIDACAATRDGAEPMRDMAAPPLRSQASVDTKLWRVLFKQRRFFSFRSASSSAGSFTKSDSDA